MKKIKTMFFTFACVTTCVVFVTALYIMIFWPQAVLGVELLWQILAVSFLCSAGICIWPERECGRGMAWILRIVQYIMTNAIVLGCGICFAWFKPDNLPMVLGMIAIIAAVFILVSVIIWKRDRYMADLMNERLKDISRKTF